MKRSDQAKARQQMLAQNPECIVCGDTNVDVLELDHIIELADGGAPNDPAIGADAVDEMDDALPGLGEVSSPGFC
jgi:hypothetical protein